MNAFHGDPRLKSQVVAQMRAHRLADQIQHGVYWENGKGCAVGCAVHTSKNPHDVCARRYGVPLLLMRLQDRIFEGLPSPDDVYFGEEFWEAIPVGADLSLVWPRFALALLTDPAQGLLHHVQAAQFVLQRVAIRQVAGYYRQWVDTQRYPPSAAAAAYGAALAQKAGYAAEASAEARYAEGGYRAAAPYRAAGYAAEAAYRIADAAGYAAEAAYRIADAAGYTAEAGYRAADAARYVSGYGAMYAEAYRAGYAAAAAYKEAEAADFAATYTAEAEMAAEAPEYASLGERKESYVWQRGILLAALRDAESRIPPRPGEATGKESDDGTHL